MPGLITGMDEPNIPTPSKPKKSIAVCILALSMFIAVPAANAGTGTSVKKPTKHFLPNPGWEVDSIGFNGWGRK